MFLVDTTIFMIISGDLYARVLSIVEQLASVLLGIDQCSCNSLKIIRCTSGSAHEMYQVVRADEVGPGYH